MSCRSVAFGVDRDCYDSTDLSIFPNSDSGDEDSHVNDASDTNKGIDAVRLTDDRGGRAWLRYCRIYTQYTGSGSVRTLSKRERIQLIDTELKRTGNRRDRLYLSAHSIIGYIAQLIPYTEQPRGGRAENSGREKPILNTPGARPTRRRSGRACSPTSRPGRHRSGG